MKSLPIKQVVSLLLIFIGAAIVVSGFFPQRAATNFDLADFGRLPVRFGTRVLPLDSMARNNLRVLSGLTSVDVPKGNLDFPDGLQMPAMQWFLDVIYRPEVASRVPIFEADHEEVLALIGSKKAGMQYFSLRELEQYFPAIEKAAADADKKVEEGDKPTTFEEAVVRLRNKILTFQELSVGFAPPGGEKDWDAWRDSIGPGGDALAAREAGKPYDEKFLGFFADQTKYFMGLSKSLTIGLIPEKQGDGFVWRNLGDGAIATLSDGQVPPILRYYAQLGDALRADDSGAFNTAVAGLQKELDVPGAAPKASFEAFINNVAPFMRGIVLYFLAFFCACVSWTAWGPELRRASLWLIIFAFALQTFGLISRVYLTGFAPVTSLYTSALFVGWIAALLGLILELWMKGGVGAAAASLVGFATLVIAHNLPFSGDDMELPRAVLATNFWLSTHVTSVTIGYAAMFVAGALATGYILVGNFSTRLDAKWARLLPRLVYGVTCFATLFSFVGTMLGGIWADQSWGRFWGWDPKENGALLIVLWCAICLHARWGKICSVRTQMALAVGGNIVTSWSWFGVNLLGTGLHSYGFITGTFWSLVAYCVTQLFIIYLALKPASSWKSQPVPASAANMAALTSPATRAE